jgi:hypothetical protein
MRNSLEEAAKSQWPDFKQICARFGRGILELLLVSYELKRGEMVVT